MKLTVYVCPALFWLMTACSPPATGPAQKGTLTIQADGITPKLAASTTPTQYNLENVNGVVEPLAHQPVSVSSKGDLTVIGWAVDKAAGTEPSGVEVVVDGKAYQSKSGLERPDVAGFFKNSGYTKTGFNFSAPADAFGQGKHQLTLRIISKDGKSYFETPGLSVNVE